MDSTTQPSHKNMGTWISVNTAWCVLVHLYSDCDQVCFGYRSTNNGELSASSVISYLIHKEDTLKKIAIELQHLEARQDVSASLPSSWNTATRFAKKHGNRVDEKDDIAELLPLGVDLVLDVIENQDGTISKYKMIYRLSFMSDNEAQNVAATLKYLIALFHTNPNQKIANLGPSDRDIKQIMSWYPHSGLKQNARLIQDVFSEQVYSQPNSMAIDAWDGQMTYAELDEASDKLKVKLHQEGLTKGTGVILCFEKSTWMAVAMLAVLKAGGFCSNIDPGYPKNRVVQIIKATDAKFLLVSKAQVETFKGYEIRQSRVIQVPSNGQPQNSHDCHGALNDSQQQERANPETTAFVVFTSGSTGVPKGIAVTHTNVCTAASALGDAFSVGSSTRTLQFAAHSWDVSVQDYMGSLLRGATVCIPSDEERWNDLEGYIARAEVNWAHLTPTVARTLRPIVISKHLRTLLLVGEPMSDADIAGWIEAGTITFNVYGCTEATWVQVSTPKQGAKVGRGHVSGYGINTNVWIVRKGGTVISPVGCTGEIWLEGPMVTKGYTNVDPMIASESFPESPEWAENSQLGQISSGYRYYRTGDLGRFCADGALEVMGRTDTQAKLGGQRLELSEVEHYLREASPFQAVSAFIPKAGSFSGRLVAVLGDLSLGTSTEGHQHLLPVQKVLGSELERCSSSITAEITRRLREVLPNFMIPVVWLRISQFPITASGKLARSQVLSKVEAMSGWAKDSVQDAQLIRQRSDKLLETASDGPIRKEQDFLQNVCATILDMEPGDVDLDKSFVWLGGDSIKAMQVVARYRAVEKRITVHNLLTSQRLCEVASKVRELHDATNDRKDEKGMNHGTEELQEIQHIRRTTRQHIQDLGKKLLALPTVTRLEEVEDVFPLSPMQESLALSLARIGGRFYMDEFVWEVRTMNGDRIDVDRLERAWKAVVARHQALRTVFVEADAEATAFDETTTETSMPLYQVVLSQNLASCNRVQAASGEDSQRVARKYPRMVDTLSHHQIIHGGLPTHSMLMVYNNAADDEECRSKIWCRLEVSHLVEDGMSILPMLRDFSLAYRNTEGLGIGKLTVGAEFIRHIRTRHRRDASLSYWGSYLKGAEPCLFPSLIDSRLSSVSETGVVMPSDVGLYEQRTILVALDEKTNGLQQAVARLDITLPTFFQLVWAMVLHVYTGKSEVVLGNIGSGRDTPIKGIEEAFGCFMGILVCRVDFGYNDNVEVDELDQPHHPTLLNIMKRIQRETIDGSNNQSCSLSEMQQAAGLFRDRSSRVPLFNSGISCRPLVTEDEQEGFTLRFNQVENIELSEMDLALIIETGRNVTRVHIQYQTSFMSDAAAVNLAETVSYLATEILRNPHMCARDVAKLSPHDHAQIWDWNKDCLEPVEKVTHSFVEERMRASPERQAVCSWDGNMTYGELDQATRRTAQYLMESCHVVPDSIVPICSEKSIWAIVAMLGVMRAGGCFVMLDPDHPDSRLLSIIEQVRPHVMLSSAKQRDRLESLATQLLNPAPGKQNATFIQVQAVTDAWVNRELSRRLASDEPNTEGTLCCDVQPQHAMYLQFTSGTTGLPKGIVISHRNFSTGFQRHCEGIEVRAHTRALQFSSYSFDASIGEILAPLSVGGCVCSPSDEDRNMDIVAFIKRTQTNWAEWTPSFVSLLDPEDVPSLKDMCVAGESLSASLVNRWSDRVRLINVYGPSECSMASTMNNPVRLDSLPSNIGRAHRCVTWIVDENDHERLRPIGATGELLIEGPLVADRGYLDRPDATSQVFIEAPSWLRAGRYARPGSRLYKTGDLVRYSSDGTINYIGRKDTQLKIHGQRVELGDIEQHLRFSIGQILKKASPPVAVELLKKTPKDTGMLAAFIVVGDTGADEEAEGDVRNHQDTKNGAQNRGDQNESKVLTASDSETLSKFRSLVERIRKSPLPLPSYMRPRIFVPLKTLPITTAGKLDRRALHQIASTMGRQNLLSFSLQDDKNGSNGIHSTTELKDSQDSESWIEVTVSGIVSELLELDAVNIQDDFFDLGGNSLLAIRLSGIIRRHNLILSVADIFEKPRLVDMVSRITSRTAVSPTLSKNTFNTDHSNLLHSENQRVLLTPSQLLRDSGIVSDTFSLDKFIEGVANECGMAVGEVDDVFPCTPLQESLMAISTVRTTNPQPYVTHQVFSLSDQVDMARLAEAWHTILCKHGLLRSRIVSTPQGGVMVMAKEPALSQCTTHNYTEAMDQYLDQHQKQIRFEYGSPLIRIDFVSCSEAETATKPEPDNEHHMNGLAKDASRRYAIFSAHHSIYDGWSLQLIWDEVVSAYRQRQQGDVSMKMNTAAVPGPSFPEFVKWVQQMAGEDSEKFWQETLVDVDAESSSSFPTVPIGHQPLAREKHTQILSQPQKPQHSNSSVTATTLIQAAWSLVLALYGGTTAATFGAVLSGRDTPLLGIEQLVGPTMATVPRHLPVRREQSIADFLNHVHRTALASMAHQHLGLDRIQRLGPGPRAACDFKSVVVVQPAEFSVSLSKAQKAIGISMIDKPHSAVSEDGFHPYALNVEFSLMANDSIGVEVRFDPDCVDRHRVQNMVRSFDVLCRRIGQSSVDDTIANIMSVLTDDFSSDLPPHPSLPSAKQFSRMDDTITHLAAQKPDSQAILATNSSLSYRQLETQASQLACHLLASKHFLKDEAAETDRKEKFIAICMPKCPLAIVAMLAIWKAGAAFLPLNISHPTSRLANLLSRANTTLVICTRKTSSMFEGIEGVETWAIDAESFPLSCSATTKINHAVSPAVCEDSDNKSMRQKYQPDDAAYLLYTSGTTGEPKGVVIQHQALCSGMDAQATAIQCDSNTRMLQCANFAFDASILEIFAPLSVGGCVCLPNEAERTGDLAGFIRRHEVNACTFTPSLLRLLDPTDLPSLRTVITGGEPLMRADVDAWLGGLHGYSRRMYNVYGVTEACVVSAAMPLTLNTNPRTVGYPVGASLWLISPVSGTFAPPGAVGELYLEGPALARGYYNDEPRTRESFTDGSDWLIASVNGHDAKRPLQESSCQRRVYRTGDLMYSNQDGSLVFLGRRDGQTKIRGQRVEPDEVTDMIPVTPFVPADCLVALITSSQPLKCGDTEDHPVYDVDGVACSLALHSAAGASVSNKPMLNDKQSSALALEAAALDAFLRRHVPEVIVPRAYIAVNELPVTPSGKLDNRWVNRCFETLTANYGLIFRGSGVDSREDEKSTLHHLTGDAGLLQKCWAEVLAVHPPSLIGVETDFFHMGGSSVTAIRLIGLLRKHGRLLKYDAAMMYSRLGDMAANLIKIQEHRPPQQNGSDIRNVTTYPFELVGDRMHLDSILNDVLPHYGIDRAHVQDVYPCTPIQEAFMAMSVIHQGAYISFHTLEVPAQKFPNFKTAWHSLHQRHELLRTRIVPWINSEDANPLQRSLSAALQVVIAPNYETEDVYWEQTSGIEDFVRDVKEGHRYGGRLVRLAWMTQPENSSSKRAKSAIRVIVAAHHAVYDGFSLNMLWRDLETEMQTLKKQVSSNTDKASAAVLPTKAAFSAFVRHLCRLDQVEILAFWKKALLGASDCTHFPVTFSSLSSSDSSSRDQPTASSTLTGTASLGSALSKHRLVDLVHGAWALTISQYTANPDVVFGVISSGRESIAGLSDLDPAMLAGPTMASAPFRLQVDYSQPVNVYLDELRHKWLDLTRFAHIGIQRISQTSSDAWHACRFESILVVQPESNYLSSSSLESATKAIDGTEGPLVDIEPLNTPDMYPHPLMIECLQPSLNGNGDQEVTINMSYDPRLVQHAFAQQMLRTFTTIVAQLAKYSTMDFPLYKLRGLAIEDESLLLERARKHKLAPVELCIQDLIHQQTCLRPDDTAVDAWDGILTYAQLAKISTRLANNLNKALGGCHGRAFPMLCHKSKWAIVAMLAIWKAGGYLVPLDPSHPVQRLRLIANTVAASTVLVSSHCLSTARELGYDYVIIDAEASIQDEDKEYQEEASKEEAASGYSCPSDLVYVLFTSGSTGTPKGVMVEHRSLSTSLVALGTSHNMSPATRTMQFASYTFDAMLVEIWSTLAFGGCVCVPSDQQRMNDITGFIVDAQVNHLFCTPSLSRMIPPEAVVPLPLEKLSLGGEAMSKGDADRWCSYSVWLSNGYGPSEACIASAVQVMTPTTPPGTVGFPLDSCRLWVVNPLKQNQDPDHYELAPVGAIGELYIEGVNVARGYVGDDIKTAAAFLERPPWLERSGAIGTGPDEEYRVFRTGDLVSYNLDGSLRFIGRRDAQVKLRGQRVELSEIEEVIRQRIQSSITVAVRVFKLASRGGSRGDDGTTSMLLVAFGVGTNSKDDARQGDEGRKDTETFVVDDPDILLNMRKITTKLQQEIRAVLPAYMIPDGYVPLQSLPFNSSGKLDEKILRERIESLSPDNIASFSTPDLASYIVEPENKTLSNQEMLLGSLWTRVLNADQISERTSSPSNDIRGGDNFFKMGGDSIMAMRLVALARQYDQRLTWRDIVTNPTLSSMARAMKNTKMENEDMSVVNDEEEYKWKAEAFKAAQDAGCLPPGVAIGDLLPATPIQEHFMNATLSFPGAHVSSLIFTVDPNLDISRLQSAFDRCAVWFPILRTRLVKVPKSISNNLAHDSVPDEMIQVPVPESPAWNFAHGSLEEALEVETRASSGLGQALSRFCVVVGAQETDPSGTRPTHLIWTQHHSCYDGWSVRALLEHVSKAYSDETYKPPAGLLPFSRFASHVHKLNQSTAALSFWSSYLKGAKASSLFNYDSVPDPRRSQSMKRKLPLPLYEAEGSSVTTATLIAAAWAKVVGRLSSSPRDVTLGYTLSGRAGSMVGLEDTIGPLLNKVPLRIRVPEESGDADEPTLLALVEETHKSLLRISDRADCPRSHHGHFVEVLTKLPMDLIVHPRGTSGGVDLLPGASIGLRASGARLSAPAPGSFCVEVSILDRGLEVLALWDERGARREQVEDAVESFAVLVRKGL
nr:nonribosomal peptide [Colletotrichum truncatum]KAF6783818.1 nonribosomal peptide [Colletotrichum truncatum]